MFMVSCDSQNRQILVRETNSAFPEVVTESINIILVNFKLYNLKIQFVFFTYSERPIFTHASYPYYVEDKTKAL